jgi:predicted deacetylase
VPHLVVSVHDVAGPHQEEVGALLRALDALGARPRVLKVVPNLEGRWPLRQDPALVKLLQAEVAAGSEVVLHGYTHRTAGPLQGPLAARLRARLFAPHDAEFLSVSPEEADGRLRAGLEELRAVGLQAEGFCAPGWLAPAWLGPLLRGLGFRYHVTMGCVHDLATGQRLLAPWFGCVGAGGLHELLVHVGGSLGAATANTPSPLVKAFFHPQNPHTWGSQLARLRRALRTRKVTTYRALLHG